MAALGIAIVILLGKRKHVGDQTPAATRVSQLPTEHEASLERNDLAKVGGKLVGGAVVTGAVLAFLIAIFLAVAVTTVTNFLK
mgnify:CR=1 FL=1